MPAPIAKFGDRIVALDVHTVLPPLGPPFPLPFPFSGLLDNGLSSFVTVHGLPVATVGSTATNTPMHFVPPPLRFAIPPRNQGRIISGSSTVSIAGRPVARTGDRALTCNDPVDLPVGTVVAAGEVWVGG